MSALYSNRYRYQCFFHSEFHDGDHYFGIVNNIQLEIGIPTVSLVYLQDNQKYVHT